MLSEAKSRCPSGKKWSRVFLISGLIGVVLLSLGSNGCPWRNKDKDDDNVVITGNSAETISTPNQTTGITSGNTNTNYSYSSGDASSNLGLGHPLQYRFDWGDGTYSDWLSSVSASHAWTTAGIYTVKAQARCSQHTSAVSSWSLGISVTISAQPSGYTYEVMIHNGGGKALSTNYQNEGSIKTGMAGSVSSTNYRNESR